MTKAGFAEEMERQAREFIDWLIRIGVLAADLYGDNRNFKPWYSPRELIDRGVGGIDQVLIGVNPGGCPGEHDPTTVERRWEQPMDVACPFNAYLDESWEGTHPGVSKLQVAVQKVFDVLSKDDLESNLRNTVCFNVCPIRTHDASCIPPSAWKASKQWCLDVLECLQPKRIICISNHGWKTPWNVVDGPPRANANFCRDVRPAAKGFPNFVLADKAGHPKLNGCEIISTPHLSRISKHELVKTLGAISEYASR